MAEIKIAELNIDVSALIKSTAEVKKSIDDIKKQQKELQQFGEESSEQFVKNASDLKVLGAEYNAGVKSIVGYTTAIAEQENRTQLLALALNTEVTSISEARSQNALLNKLRNETNVTTSEGKQQLDELNKKLDSNNDFIKENADAYLKQKINIGNYSDSLKEALGNLNPLNGGLSGFIQRSQEAGGAGNLFRSSIGEASKSILGLTKSALAFVATPFGAILTLIAGAVSLLIAAFKSFTPIVDKVEKAVSALAAVFNVVKNSVIALATGAKSLTQVFSSLGGEMVSAAKDAASLKKAQQDLEDAMASQEVQSAKNRAEINRLNIQAKDRTKSEEERLALLKKAEQLEEADFNQRKKNSDESVRQAQEEIRINAQLTDAEFSELKKRGIAYKEFVETKASGQDELFDKLKSALLKETDIQNEFYTNQEKNINKQNKLIEDAEARKEKAEAEAQKRAEEAEAKRQKMLDDAFSKSQAELALYLSQQGVREKTFEENIKIAEKTYQKQLEINKKEFEASEKTAVDKLNLETANNEARNALMKTQSDLVIENAKHELDVFIQNNKSKLDAEKYHTEEMVLAERERLELIANERRDFEAVKLAEGVINQQQYNDAINTINEENKIALQEIELAEETAKLEKQAIDLENYRIANENDFLFKVQDLERRKQEELKNAEKTGAEKKLIEDKYRLFKSKLDEEQRSKELSGVSNVLGQTLGLLKENTAAYKIIASGKALIDTYQSAVAAYNAGVSVGGPAGLVLGPVSAGLAVAAGLANVAKINGAKFAGGGFTDIEGNSHAMGGVPIYAGNKYIGEAQGGEGIAIMNKGAFSQFKAFNNTYGDGDVSRNGFFAGGGIITQAVTSKGVDMNELLSVTTQAISSLPPPRVAIEDINTNQTSFVEVVNGANF